MKLVSEAPRNSSVALGGGNGIERGLELFELTSVDDELLDGSLFEGPIGFPLTEVGSVLELTDRGCGR